MLCAQVIEEDLYFPGSLSDPLILPPSGHIGSTATVSSTGLDSSSSPSLLSTNSPSASSDLLHATSTTSSPVPHDGSQGRLQSVQSSGKVDGGLGATGETLREKMRQSISAVDLSRVSGEFPDKIASESEANGRPAALDLHERMDRHRLNEDERTKNRKSLSPKASQETFRLLGVPSRSASMSTRKSSSSAQSPPPLPTSSQAQTSNNPDRPYGRKRSLSALTSRKVSAPMGMTSPVVHSTSVHPPLPIPQFSNHSQPQAQASAAPSVKPSKSEGTGSDAKFSIDGMHNSEKSDRNRVKVKVHPLGLVLQTPQIHKSKSRDNGRSSESRAGYGNASKQQQHELGGNSVPRSDNAHVRQRSGPDSAGKQKVLYHPSPRQLFNPRDHSLLERIYVEMHESRFINLTPLALLTNSLGLYFKGVC